MNFDRKFDSIIGSRIVCLTVPAFILHNLLEPNFHIAPNIVVLIRSPASTSLVALLQKLVLCIACPHNKLGR